MNSGLCLNNLKLSAIPCTEKCSYSKLPEWTQSHVSTYQHTLHYSELFCTLCQAMNVALYCICYSTIITTYVYSNNETLTVIAEQAMPIHFTGCSKKRQPLKKHYVFLSKRQRLWKEYIINFLCDCLFWYTLSVGFIE